MAEYTVTNGQIEEGVRNEDFTQLEFNESDLSLIDPVFSAFEKYFYQSLIIWWRYSKHSHDQTFGYFQCSNIRLRKCLIHVNLWSF